MVKLTWKSSLWWPYFPKIFTFRQIKEGLRRLFYPALLTIKCLQFKITSIPILKPRESSYSTCNKLWLPEMGLLIPSPPPHHPPKGKEIGERTVKGGKAYVSARLCKPLFLKSAAGNTLKWKWKQAGVHIPDGQTLLADKDRGIRPWGFSRTRGTLGFQKLQMERGGLGLSHFPRASESQLAG